VAAGVLAGMPLTGQVAAISCGLVEGRALLDLDYEEDSGAQADANFVLTGEGEIVEIQATAEEKPFAGENFLSMLDLAKKGIAELVDIQKQALAPG
jgi:ribonuclease PH